MLGGDLDASQFRELPKTEKCAMRKCAGFEKYHEIRPPGEGTPNSRFARQAIESCGKVLRSLQFVSRYIGSQRDGSVARIAARTDSKIFV